MHRRISPGTSRAIPVQCQRPIEAISLEKPDERNKRPRKASVSGEADMRRENARGPSAIRTGTILPRKVWPAVPPATLRSFIPWGTAAPATRPPAHDAVQRRRRYARLISSTGSNWSCKQRSSNRSRPDARLRNPAHAPSRPKRTFAGAARHLRSSERTLDAAYATAPQETVAVQLRSFASTESNWSSER